MNKSDETTSQANAYQAMVNYESLSFLTGQMREAAICEEWDQLIALEQRCRRHVATMKSADNPAVLNEPARQRKIQIIKKILADDATIRQRTELWMEQLQRIMHSSHQALRLHRVYGA